MSTSCQYSLLNDKRMERIIKRLDGRCRLIYSDLPDDATTIVPSTEDLKNMMNHSLGKANALPIDKFIQEEQNDANGRRIETSAKNRDKFFKVQENMNTHTTIANDYGTTCERLKLIPKKPLMPGQLPGQTGPETELKPHQVVALDWLLQIEKLIDGALLADDMGLGKTVTALSVIKDLKAFSG